MRSASDHVSKRMILDQMAIVDASDSQVMVQVHAQDRPGVARAVREWTAARDALVSSVLDRVSAAVTAELQSDGLEANAFKNEQASDPQSTLPPDVESFIDKLADRGANTLRSGSRFDVDDYWFLAAGVVLEAQVAEIQTSGPGLPEDELPASDERAQALRVMKLGGVLGIHDITTRRLHQLRLTDVQRPDLPVIPALHPDYDRASPNERCLMWAYPYARRAVAPQDTRYPVLTETALARREIRSFGATQDDQQLRRLLQLHPLRVAAVGRSQFLEAQEKSEPIPDRLRFDGWILEGQVLHAVLEPVYELSRQVDDLMAGTQRTIMSTAESVGAG